MGVAGPLFSVLGFLVFPFFWSIPEALITAELATAFPGNGGCDMGKPSVWTLLGFSYGSLEVP